MQLLARYLDRTDRRVYALVRAENDEQAATRLRATVAAAIPDAEAHEDRLVAVAGDITRPGLGLDSRRRDELAEAVTEVMHAAASVSFTLPLDEARTINVEGTRRMLELAERSARSQGSRRRALKRSEAFFPYFAMRVHYDTARASRRLEPTGCQVTPLPRYFGRLVDYALAARWGKHPRSRSQLIASGTAGPRVASERRRRGAAAGIQTA